MDGHAVELYVDAGFTSPWSLSVWAALQHKGIAFGERLLDLQRGEHRAPAYADATLTGKIPSLRHGAVWICESLAILEYLDEAFPGTPPLLPQTAAARAHDREILSWLRTDLSELRRCMPYEGLFGTPVDVPMTEAARAQVGALVRATRRRLAQRGTAAPTWADVELAAALRRPMFYRHDLSDAAEVVAFSDAIWAWPAIQSWVTHRRA